MDLNERLKNITDNLENYYFYRTIPDYASVQNFAFDIEACYIKEKNEMLTYSIAVMFIPISSRPPSGITFTLAFSTFFKNVLLLSMPGGPHPLTSGQTAWRLLPIPHHLQQIHIYLLECMIHFFQVLQLFFLVAQSFLITLFLTYFSPFKKMEPTPIFAKTEPTPNYVFLYSFHIFTCTCINSYNISNIYKHRNL